MMTLDTMQRIVATVSDESESELADLLIQKWENDGSRAKCWRASANFVFFFRNQGNGRVLRFNHEAERTAAAVESEIRYLHGLIRCGVPLARPIVAKSGNFVESVSTTYGVLHASVFEKIEGDQLTSADLSSQQIVRWGQALGELHNASSAVGNPGRLSWEDHLANAARELSHERNAVRSALRKTEAQLHQLPRESSNFGVIHFDFELDNIIWEGDLPRPIDFDDSAAYWFVADIAFALRDLFEDNANQVNLANESFCDFVTGYRRVRPIESSEIDHVPLFLRLHHLLSLSRLHRAVTPPVPGEMPWMADLRQRLSEKMQTYREILAS